MSEDYRPTFLRGSNAEFEPVNQYPDGFQYGSGVDFESEWTPPDAPDTSPRTEPGPESFGKERHPSIVVHRLGEFCISAYDPLIHRCDGDDLPRYIVGLPVVELPLGLADADISSETIELRVFGTRKDDTKQIEAEIADINPARSGGLIVQFALPPGEIGALYRWWATGCLVCRGGS
jgi:hypothetical protein